MPARFTKLGDPHAAMDAAKGSLDKLLELAARDEASGLADAPWPPHFPEDGRRGTWRVAAVASAHEEGGTGRRGEARRGAGGEDDAHEDAAPDDRELTPDKDAALAGLSALESEVPGRSEAARRGRRAGRLDARALVDLDAHPREPAQRAGRRSDPRKRRRIQTTIRRAPGRTRRRSRGRGRRRRAKGTRPSRPSSRAPRAQRAKIVASSCGGTTSSCANVHSWGRLSVRHRLNCAV